MIRQNGRIKDQKCIADPECFYDVVIIGGGPAGLTAAIYLARAKYRVLVAEREQFGGQITITDEVVNYPGIERISGKALTENMRRQAEHFGAEFMLAEVESLEPEGAVKSVKTSRGTLQCFGILLATGARPRKVGFSGEDTFRGHGVAYCATCDGEFFTGKEVFVIGGGFAAAEESVFLTKYASHVTVLIRGEDFRCAESAAEAARNHEKITVLTNTQVEEVAGDSVPKIIRYRNRITGEETVFEAPERDTFGVFVFAGYEPDTGLVRGLARLDEQGYVVTDRRQCIGTEGIYAAGDVCAKSLRQVVTATGDGALAATELERYAAAMQADTGLVPVRPKMKAAEGTGGITGEEQKKTARTDGAEEERKENGMRDELFSPEMLSQLKTVFSGMEKKLILRIYSDGSLLSEELIRYARELSALTEKLSAEVITETDAGTETDGGDTARRPCVQIRREDGTWSGLAFHGVPGGHEFTSFILGLYNAAGPGQTTEPGLLEEIRARDRPLHMKILVSLSCTMCPELVTAAQRIAAENDRITAEVYDLNHFPDLKERYEVMSVPCLILNDRDVTFGKKNVRQLLERIREMENISG